MNRPISVTADEATARLCAHWLELAERAFAQRSFLTAIPAAATTAPGSQAATGSPGWWPATLLPTLLEVTGGETAELVRQAGPRWVSLARSGPGSELLSRAGADSLVADCLDSLLPVARQRMIAAAIDRGEAAVDEPGPVGPMVLLLSMPSSGVGTAMLDAAQLDRVARAARVLAVLDRTQRWILAGVETAKHLRYLLEASIRWSSIEDTDELLGGIAAAATEMLSAERASIFLWDKRRGKLVGRPALGVEGGKLEVDDKTGIVGSVLASGRPQIWTAGDDRESEVNRSVDRKLKFVTRSLVAVPLRSPSGQSLGVFEVVNRLAARGGKGGFDAADVAKLSDLARHAAAAILGTETRQRLTRTRDRLLSDAASSAQVIGNSPAIRSLRDTVARVAPTDLAVLALGENGTGKEVVARCLHFQSQRRGEPFVAVNCAALVESLLESELFGHERGAFTDAHQARPGKFELASGGTLFLDEIGDMSPGGQAKLLRVLEEKIVVRVGGSVPIPVDVRIIAATNQSLAELVAAKRFREDLFFRLNVVSFRLPPLRERGDDILRLAEHFLAQFATQIGRVEPKLSSAAREALLRYRWPGNIRELRNVMERASYLVQSDVISEADLGLTLGESVTGGSAGGPAATISTAQSLSEATRAFQARHIAAAIEHHRGNMTAAARTLGLHRSNLYRKMRQLDMNTDQLENELLGD